MAVFDNMNLLKQNNTAKGINTMYLVKIWNVEKIEGLTGVTVNTHNELLILEEETGHSYSSCFICENPEGAINGIYNETDQDLSWCAVDVKDNKRFKGK
jgi:hypothetical protein